MEVGEYETSILNGIPSTPYVTSISSLQFTQQQEPEGLENQATEPEAMELLPTTTAGGITSFKTGVMWSNQTVNPPHPLQNTLQNLSDLQDLSSKEDLENVASQMDKDKEEFFAVFLKHLDNYVLPVIILLGIVGNIISFTVFICTHLKRTSCNIYLAALATSDTTFLLCVFLSWSADIYNRNGWCQTLVYLTYVTGFLSVWYIVAFTTERFILVCFPSKRHKVCTPQVAQVIVIVLTCFAFAFYSFSPIVSGINSFHGHTICAPLPDYDRVSWILNNLDTLLTLVIPVIIILGCNIKIARLVCTFYKSKPPKPYHYVCKWEFTGQSQNNNTYHTNMYMRRSYNSVSTTGIHSTILLPNAKSGSNYQIKATRMLLIVSTVFLVCNLPTHAVRFHGFIMYMIDNSYVPSRSFILWQKFFQTMYYINFSVNFFLYSFSSRSFRLGFRRLSVKAEIRLSHSCRKGARARSPERIFRTKQCSQLLPGPHVTLKEAETTT